MPIFKSDIITSVKFRNKAKLYILIAGFIAIAGLAVFSIWIIFFKSIFTKQADCPFLMETSSNPCKFELKGWQYSIDISGKAKRYKNNIIQAVNLEKEDKSFIDNRIYFCEYENDFILIYPLTDNDAGWGRVARIDGKTLKTK